MNPIASAACRIFWAWNSATVWQTIANGRLLDAQWWRAIVVAPNTLRELVN
jgi:hypothetical protein